MYELIHSSTVSLPAIWRLEDYIRANDPRFVILSVIKSPHPRLKVRDAVYGIVIAFSCEADYHTYCRITSQLQQQHEEV